MKNLFKILFFSFIILTSFISCRSSKDLIFFKDAANDKINHGLPIDYSLKSGDILYVSIKSNDANLTALYNPESNMQAGSAGQEYMKYTTPSGAYLYGFELDADGYINLPMLGKILKDAIIKVKLLNFKFAIAGEVRTPGVYYNYNNSITVLEALAMASGNTDFASIKKVMIIRPTPKGEKTFMLDLSTKKAYLSEAFYLQPNDYVIVQPDKYKNFQLNSQAYSLVLSSLSVLIAVLGFVIPNL